MPFVLCYTIQKEVKMEHNLIQPLKQITVEELKEQAEEVDYLTPREFAKLTGIKPQQVYMWIRKGVLQSERCRCGRTIIRVSLAQAAIQARKASRGKILDNRPDRPGDEGLGSDVQDMPQANTL
jgi:excisionase family DNA binding protein